jgi:hypothetical protein
MGLFDFLKRRIAGGKRPQPGTLSTLDLAKRLGMEAEELRSIEAVYQEFTIPKRSGGHRVILAPAPALKAVQRRILQRLLRKLKCHPAVHGFECGRSIVTNAFLHAGQAVVVRMDLKDFFRTTSVERVRDYYYKIGWNKESTQLLLRLCTYRDGLPQGAPTSPRLSSLVNARMDSRLAAMATSAFVSRARNPRTGATRPRETDCRAVYTRYADDLTFSFAIPDAETIHNVIWFAKKILHAEGYELHMKKKLQIRRWYDRQLVTGLVVNERVNLPRELRRRLRAVEHHLRTGRPATLTPDQLAGWRAFQAMVTRQSAE